MKTPDAITTRFAKALAVYSARVSHFDSESSPSAKTKKGIETRKVKFNGKTQAAQPGK